MSYPEHEKLKAARVQSQAQGEFLAWLQNEKGMFLCVYDRLKSNYPSSITTPVIKLLAEYHGIDLNKLEDEKLAMLEEQRKLNEHSR